MTDKKQIINLPLSYKALQLTCANYKKRTEFLTEELARKAQEYEELKEQLQADQPVGICEICIATAILQNDKYYKALEEIESIADDYNRTNKTSQYYRDGFEEILNIINKAKGEEKCR